MSVNFLPQPRTTFACPPGVPAAAGLSDAGCERLVSPPASVPRSQEIQELTAREIALSSPG